MLQFTPTGQLVRVEEDSCQEVTLIDEWDKLFLGTPPYVWKKKQLQRKPGEHVVDYHGRIQYSYLVSKGLREIGQNPENEYTEESLALILLMDHFADARNKGWEAIGWSTRTDFIQVLTSSSLPRYEGFCRRAARWALKNFSREKYTSIQEHARRAGSVTKYGLEHYKETLTMSFREAAAHLGCSVSTIQRLRDRFKDYVDLETGEIQDMEIPENETPEEREARITAFRKDLIDDGRAMADYIGYPEDFFDWWDMGPQKLMATLEKLNIACLKFDAMVADTVEQLMLEEEDEEEEMERRYERF